MWLHDLLSAFGIENNFAGAFDGILAVEKESRCKFGRCHRKDWIRSQAGRECGAS